MLPTVADLLTLPVLRHGHPTVAAGSTGLTNPVRWIHVAEVADIAPLLRGGELVLTTGVALPEAPEELADYIAALSGVGAAGLVVELVRRWQRRLPDALVRAADEHGLPLVTLGAETRFVAVTEAVITVIRDAQLAELRAAEQVHQTFTALTEACAEPADVLRELAGIVRCPVVLETLEHDVLAYDAAGEDPEELLVDWRTRSRAVSCGDRVGYDPTTGWLVAIVGARGEDWGRLVLRCADVPTHPHTVAAQRAASALAVHRLITKDRDTVERSAHRGLLAELLTTGSLAADVTTRSNALGIPLTGRKLVGLAIRPRAPQTGREHAHDLTEAAAGAARRAGTPALVGSPDATVLRVLLSVEPKQPVESLVRATAGAVHQAAGEVVVAMGTVVDSVHEARRTLTEAEHVAAAALRTGGHRDVHRLVDVRLRGLLHLLSEDQRVTAFVERELGALLDRDAKQGSRLVEVLRRYVQHGGNKSAAAASAHLSRTAYYQQLARIEQVLGVSLEEPESTLSLYVALLALDAGAGRPG